MREDAMWKIGWMRGAAILLTALVIKPVTGAEIISTRPAVPGWRLVVTMEPPAGWQRRSEGAATIFSFPNTPPGHSCFIHLYAPEYLDLDAPTGHLHFQAVWNKTLAEIARSGGQVLRQVPNDWEGHGSSPNDSGGNIVWIAREVDFTTGGPTQTLLLFIAVTGKSAARQGAVYFCSDPAAKQVTETPAIDALRSLNLKLHRETNCPSCPQNRAACMAKCDGPYYDLVLSCHAACLRDFEQ
jgi:hypothetical protein